MRRLWIIPIACVALLVPAIVLAGGAESGFDGVVRSVEVRYHVRATHIPFLGLMSFIAGRATHGGVGSVKIAMFEHFDDPVDGSELNAMVEEKLGEGWERMIRETSRHGSDQTLIFAHPEGERMGLFIINAEAHEMNIIQVSVDPKHIDDDIGRFSHHHHRSDYDADSDSDSDSSEKD